MNKPFPCPNHTPPPDKAAALLGAFLAFAPTVGGPAPEAAETTQLADEILEALPPASESHKGLQSLAENPHASKAGRGGVLGNLRAEDLPALLERHRGKVVLVNFWATWCGPCIHEIPALLRVKERLDPALFTLIPVSVDDPADSSWLVEDFIEARFTNWYSYLSTEPEDYLMVEELDPHWPGVLPANYLIGPGGDLADTLLGGHDEQQFEERVRAVMQRAERHPEEVR